MVRRGIVLLVGIVAVVGASASAASAGFPPGDPGPTLPTTTIPVPVRAEIDVRPDAGPIGSKVKIHGVCGFRSTQLLFGVHIKTANGFQILWIPEEFATPHGRFGVFTTGFRFPAFGNVPPELGGLGPVPVTPGIYYVGARCVGAAEPFPFQPFTVTPGRL
jgi:hypothetical protein